MWSFITPQNNNNNIEDENNNNNNNDVPITTSLWNLLGYTEASPKEENKSGEGEKEEKENLSELQTEHADIKETTSYEQFLESERDFLNKNEKKKKEKNKRKEKKNEEQPNNNDNDNNNYNESPLMSDISSFANQGSDNGREENLIRDGNLLEEEENDAEVKEEETSDKPEKSTLLEVMKNPEEKDEREELEENNVEEKNAENWLFIGKFKSMLEPSINQESFSEIISTQYMNFSQANAGLFDLLENLILSGNSKGSEENKGKDTNNKKPYGSYEESPNPYYNFIDYAIYSINRELSANIEMEALRMVKIYNAAYIKFKEEINYRDDVFHDIVNEAEEYSTYKYNEKKKKKKNC